jgi:hypothetical protein
VPGVSTAGLFYELLPRVWVYLPVQEDLTHNILWTLRDEDLAVVEGYLRAQATRLHPGAGMVLRPQVLGDDRSDTSALIADCVLPVDGGPSSGQGFTLALRGGEWVVESSYSREDACW